MSTVSAEEIESSVVHSDTKEKSSHSTVYLKIIVILLTAIFVFDVGMQVIQSVQRQQRIQEITETQTLLENQINTLMTNYQASAYDNPSVERIAEQQLLAQEFTLQSLQLISMQNQLILNQLNRIP